MAKVVDFSPDQIEEAKQWLRDNNPKLSRFLDSLPDIPIDSGVLNIREEFYDIYFQLKMISKELRPNQFIMGVDYKSSGNAEIDRRRAEEGLIKFNLSFWNPHPKGMADQLAKDFLIAQLSRL